MTTQVTDAHVRWMIRRDVPEVLAIENESFDIPWDEVDFLACLRQRNAIGMVCESGDRVVGFVIYELHKTRLRIVNFAVARTHRRLGVGTSLIGALLEKLSAVRRREIVLAIGDENLDGQLFLRAMGFRAVRVLREFDEETGRDAYLMVRCLCGGDCHAE